MISHLMWAKEYKRITEEAKPKEAKLQEALKPKKAKSPELPKLAEDLLTKDQMHKARLAKSTQEIPQKIVDSSTDSEESSIGGLPDLVPEYKRVKQEAKRKKAATELNKMLKQREANRNKAKRKAAKRNEAKATLKEAMKPKTTKSS